MRALPRSNKNCPGSKIKSLQKWCFPMLTKALKSKRHIQTSRWVMTRIRFSMLVSTMMDSRCLSRALDTRSTPSCRCLSMSTSASFSYRDPHSRVVARRNLHELRTGSARSLPFKKHSTLTSPRAATKSKLTSCRQTLSWLSCSAPPEIVLRLRELLTSTQRLKRQRSSLR